MINKMDLSNKAIYLRKRLGEDGISPLDIFSLVQAIPSLTLVFYPFKEISGICYKGKYSNVIIINSEMSIGRQRFSLAHELYHLYFDNSGIHSVSYMTIGSGDDNEKMADQFASYFLIPQASLFEQMKHDVNDGWRDCNDKEGLGIEDIIRLEQYYGVSHQAMLYRLLDEKYLTYDEFKKMESGVVSMAARLGYDTSLYYPSDEHRKILVLGHYIKMANQRLEEERISQGKYEELLLDAFRDDIVYGSDQEEDAMID